MKRILTILLILNLLVIWVNSALPADWSHTLSDWLVYGMETAFAGGSGVQSASSRAASSAPSPANNSHISDSAKQTLADNADTASLRTAFRKGAHALEFFTFGVLCLLVLAASGDWRRRLERLTAVGVSVALVDETIQIFSKRTSTLSDVWLDLAGFTVGALLAFGVVALRRRRA